MTILAHMEVNRTKHNEQKQMNGGKDVDGGKNWMRAVGMAGTQMARQAKPSLQTLRPAQALKKQPADGRLRSKNTTAADDVLPLAVQVSGGVQWYWQP